MLSALLQARCLESVTNARGDETAAFDDDPCDLSKAGALGGDGADGLGVWYDDVL